MASCGRSCWSRSHTMAVAIVLLAHDVLELVDHALPAFYAYNVEKLIAQLKWLPNFLRPLVEKLAGEGLDPGVLAGAKDFLRDSPPTHCLGLKSCVAFIGGADLS